MPAPPTEGSPAPAASPMSQPGSDAGTKQAAGVSVQSAILLLQRAFQGFGVNSKEGRTLLDVLKKLAVDFGNDTTSQQLAPAQIIELMRSAQTGNPVTAPTPPQ